MRINDIYEITFTLPLFVPTIDGQAVFAEVDCMVEVRITYPGTPGRTYGPPERCWPAEGPEWEELHYYVEEVGRGKQNRWLPAPADISTRIKAYLETREGGDTIAEQLMEKV